MSVVSLAEVKAHLNITGTQHDAELPSFIETAQEIVASRVGPLEPVTVTEIHDGTYAYILLRTLPVRTVTSVTTYWHGVAGTPVLSADLYLDAITGELSNLSGVRFGGTRQLVTYEAGRDVCPATLKWAVKELTAHLWKSTQNQRGGRSRGEDTTAPAGYLLPNRVEDAIEPYLLTPAVG